MNNTHLYNGSILLPPIGTSLALNTGTAQLDETQSESTGRNEADLSQQDGTADELDDGGSSSDPDSDEEGTTAGYKLPLDQKFELLKNKRRRMTLQYLEENDGTATLSDLSEHIAAIENDTSVKAISSSQRKRVYVGLYQCHLPKMDDAAVIEFDKNRGTIKLGPNADQLEAYLGEPEREPWHVVYAAVALVGGGLFVASQAGAATYGLTPSVVLLLLLLGILVSAGAHYHRTQPS